ncbi:hypothetical protein C7U92_31375 [Bradyrhizobium sp. WBOS7]|uniref:Uncharacterized protein n=1 Tax=Bradyrhizobium betae TaxID=244734 RepID=A0AAE9N571_9BRAD|nr:hypothetical protein [Bradyrhizobium sp. WBOS2]MDD1575004.1 hypothetical protein [Bradyrhizobium sp. WBOS1]MDD1581188.1 hypothetical protein [Bradyrhizobium sp. WBOS7]MDD1604699.1 hypothetical protein [Bradyrhizobium sp. WBOS16]UUO34052.1 hypothetical protein DCK84_05310 [Bradyrhizobium sp. WBOS01]UUO40585.1 hypothetical protein DCM75_07345 [Bradyrhizobium sp. WBOS02]UUO52750.1 hypothetical protein DCM79_06985 [Bradyrhizobium sp. WBOS07]UUO64581.1 hypothetical protein DCM83_04670 [Bradyrh
MESLPIELLPAMAGVELGQQRQLRQSRGDAAAPSLHELREGLGCGFGEKFFVMRETIGRNVRAGRDIPQADDAVGWAKAQSAVPTISLRNYEWWARFALPTLRQLRRAQMSSRTSEAQIRDP